MLSQKQIQEFSSIFDTEYAKSLAELEPRLRGRELPAVDNGDGVHNLIHRARTVEAKELAAVAQDLARVAASIPVKGMEDKKANRFAWRMCPELIFNDDEGWDVILRARIKLITVAYDA